jgi:hypothetical protein
MRGARNRNKPPKTKELQNQYKKKHEFQKNIFKNSKKTSINSNKYKKTKCRAINLSRPLRKWFLKPRGKTVEF